MIWKLAWQNLKGAGLRTWLNVLVLSFSFVVIVWHKGFLEGWNRQARTDTIQWELGAGQLWHQEYDPYDPYKLRESMAPMTSQMLEAQNKGQITPILITQAVVYPEGRMQNVFLKGIDPNQSILNIPTQLLIPPDQPDPGIWDFVDGSIPALVGTRMASNLKIKQGDTFTVRWRDSLGTFDANEIVIVGLFKTSVPTVDVGQIWIPLNYLRSMMSVADQATLMVVKQGTSLPKVDQPWVLKDHDALLAELDQIIKQKSIGGLVLYGLLLALALLALFDTQVLSVFRRQREIGTMMALGMARREVIKLFTLEGTLTAILAACLAALYGTPLLGWQAINGISMPEMSDGYGLAIADAIYPAFSLGLILTSSLIVILAATIVSYLPAHKIATMNPTDAIRGKLQ